MIVTRAAPAMKKPGKGIVSHLPNPFRSAHARPSGYSTFRPRSTKISGTGPNILAKTPRSDLNARSVTAVRRNSRERWVCFESPCSGNAPPTRLGQCFLNGNDDAMTTSDPEFYQAPKFTPEPSEAPKQRGCLFYGCIIASILALLMVVAIGLVFYLGYRFLNQAVEEWTSTAPRELSKVEMPPEKRQALKDRVEAFRKAVEAGTPTEPLVLTSDDLNALIEEDPKLKGKIYVTLEGEKVKGQISFPLEGLQWSMFKGRYLNGEADLKASLKDGILIVTLESFEVNGKRPPENFIAQLRQRNLAEDAYNNPKQAEMLRKVESMEIKDGKIIIALKRRTAEADGQKTQKQAPPAAGAPPSSPEKPASETRSSDQPVEVKPPAQPAPEPAPKP
jgi:hypothetical protein